MNDYEARCNLLNLLSMTMLGEYEAYSDEEKLAFQEFITGDTSELEDLTDLILSIAE